MVDGTEDDMANPDEVADAESWQMFANCLGVDPDLFFPERGASTKEAKGVCQGCVVREDCLEYALANGEKFGIWGGLSERERRRIRRQRAGPVLRNSSRDGLAARPSPTAEPHRTAPPFLVRRVDSLIASSPTA